MATRRLPPYVQAVRNKHNTRYRGWYTVDGRRIFTPTCATPDEAYELAKVGRDESVKVRRKGSVPSLEEAMDLVREDARARLTAGSLRWYEDHFAALLRTWNEDTPLHEITPTALEDWIRERRRKVTARTVNADLRALGRCYVLAIRRGYAGANPVRLVDRPREVEHEMDYFESSELPNLLLRVLNLCGQHTQDVLTFVACTGIRRSELARVELEHVGLSGRVLWIAGKRRGRRIALSDDGWAAAQRLVQGRQGETLLIAGGTREIDRVFRDAKRKLQDKRLHPHALRHTFGTALARAGVDPYTLRDLMGHRDLRTTMRYYHGHSAAQRAAVSHLRPLAPLGGTQQRDAP